MVDPARIGAEIAAAVHGENFKPGMPFEHAVKNQIMQRDRGLERIADDVVEIKALKARGLGEAVGVDHHQNAKLFGLLPERREGRIGQLLAVYIGEDFDAGEAKRLDAALELLGGFVAVGHRHRAKAFEAVRMFAAIFGDTVIDEPRRFDRDVERH